MNYAAKHQKKCKNKKKTAIIDKNFTLGIEFARKQLNAYCSNKLTKDCQNNVKKVRKMRAKWLGPRRVNNYLLFSAKNIQVSCTVSGVNDTEVMFCSINQRAKSG